MCLKKEELRTKISRISSIRPSIITREEEPSSKSPVTEKWIQIQREDPYNIPDAYDEKSKLLQWLVLTLSNDLTWIYCLYILAALGLLILILALVRYFCSFDNEPQQHPIRDPPYEQELEILKQEEDKTEETEEKTSDDQTPASKRRYTFVLTPQKVRFAKATRH